MESSLSESEYDSDSGSEVKELKLSGVKQLLEFVEIFDQDKLAYIIQNKEKLKELMRNTSDILSGSYDPFLIPEKYLKTSQGGRISVQYLQPGDFAFGRFFAKESLSLQGFPREIRHSVAKDLYDDIDIVNAHPVILSHICNILKINCKSLTLYINNRDKYLKEIGIPREDAKKLILALMNGGVKDYNELKNPTRWLVKFKDEIENIHASLAKTYPKDYTRHVGVREKEDKVYNNKASFCNKLMCDWENKILQEIIKFYNVGSGDVAVLCFDGIMLPKGARLPLSECEKYIKEVLNISIKLKIKEMDEGLTIPTTVEPYNPELFEWRMECTEIYQLIYKDSYAETFNDETVGKLFVMEVQKDIVTIDDDGNGYQWNHETKLWEEKTAKSLMRCIPQLLDKYMEAVIKTIKQTYLKSSGDEAKFHGQILKNTLRNRNRLGSARGMKDGFFIASTDLRDNEFEAKLNIQHHLFPVLGNKVIDLRTGMKRTRKRDDMFSFECPVELVSDPDYTHVMRFVNSVFCKNKELIQYMRERMGMFLTGDSVREFDIWHGEGRNAKSTLCKLLSDILGSGKFYNALSDGIFVENPKLSQTQKSQHTSHKVPLIGIRLGVCQEIKKNAVLNSNEIKTLSAGDPFKCRGAYEKKEKECIPFCKLVLGTNHKPKFDADDQAIIDRARYIPFMARFVDNPDPRNPREYKADKDFVELMMTREQRNIFFTWLVGGAIEFYKKGRLLHAPQLVLDDKMKSLKENDVVGQFVDECCEVFAGSFGQLNREEKKEWTTSLNDLQVKFDQWSENSLTRGELSKSLEKMGLKKKRSNGFKFLGIRFVIDLDSISDSEDDDM